MAPPKRGGKPIRLLNPSKTTVKAKKIVEANANGSGFFRLSPELRNKVYILVLGGNHIHVDREGPRHGICLAIKSDKASAEDHTNGKPENFQEAWRARHSACLQAGPLALLNLSLLTVCKQIHEEAALLPLESNSFIFHSDRHLAAFANQLLAAQRPSVRNISLVKLGDFRYEPPYLLQKAAIKKLSGLRDLTYTVEVRTYRWYSEPPPVVVQSLLKEVKQTFERQSLVAAKVRVSERFFQVARECTKEFAVWACETEQALLAQWDQEAYEAELNRKRQGEEDGRAQRGVDRTQRGLRKVTGRNYAI